MPIVHRRFSSSNSSKLKIGDNAYWKYVMEAQTPELLEESINDWLTINIERFEVRKLFDVRRHVKKNGEVVYRQTIGLLKEVTEDNISLVGKSI